MQGDLNRDALGDVIRTLYVNRRSGVLHLARGTVTKRIYFSKGSMIFANSDVEADRLGEFLIRRQVITRTDLEQASRVTKETGERFGRTVVELGHTTAEQMEVRVVEQIQTIIYSLFDWDSGEYRFEQRDNPVDEDIVLNLSTADIILEGARRLDDLSKVRRAVGDPARVPRTTEDPLLLYQKMSTLSQSEGFILSRVDGLTSVADILAISPIGEEATLRCIYGLVSAGVLEFPGSFAPGDAATEPTPNAETPAPAASAAPAASTERAGPPPGVEIPRPDIEVRRPELQPTKPNPGEVEEEPARPSPEEIAVREDIIEKHASLRESNLYDLLGIASTADDGEVKKAYYAMAKKYHPDRHHSPHLRDIHGLLEELFGKITDAYELLSSPPDRTDYDARIRGEGAGGSASSSDGDPDSARKKAAEGHYKEGKRHFDEMHFFDAIRCLKEALRLHPNKSYHKLLARALMKNPKWLREAEEQFRMVLKTDPFDAECYVGLGEIYESEGMSTRALKMFEQAASYDPENETIRRKMEDNRSPGMGALKKLFGRKKD